jgi:hypothetical protein
MTRSFTRVNVLALSLSWLLLSSVATEARVPVNAERMRQLIEVNQRVNTTSRKSLTLSSTAVRTCGASQRAARVTARTSRS